MDGILYRNFMLVAAFIAAMGVITANIVVATRPADRAREWMPAGNTPSGSCADPRHCGWPQGGLPGRLPGHPAN